MLDIQIRHIVTTARIPKHEAPLFGGLFPTSPQKIQPTGPMKMRFL